MPAPPLKVAFIVGDEREVRLRPDLPEPYFGPAPSALLSGFREISGVEIHIVSCVRRDLQAPAKLAENIHFHAVRVPSWAFLKTLFLPSILAIRKKLARIKPDVAHGQGTEAYYGLAAAYSGFPNVLTIHGNMRQVARAVGARPFSYLWLIAQLEGWTLPRVGGVICLSTYTRRQVESRARRTWLLPNAVDDAFFKIDRAPRPDPVILCVADIAPYKNQNLLIKTLDPVAAKWQLRLVFLGRVDESSEYGREFLSLVSSRPWCEFGKYQSGGALRDFFRTSRLLVLPSSEDNCPMVLLEAMAAGLPAAASRIGGIPDLVENGVNGLLFDPRSAAEIVASLERLFLDADFARLISSNARQNARARFQPAVVAASHLQIYRDLLRSSH